MNVSSLYLGNNQRHPNSKSGEFTIQINLIGIWQHCKLYSTNKAKVRANWALQLAGQAADSRRVSN